MKILFLGDIVGKIGRRAVAKVLPDWKEEHDPDFVIANGENLAHGKGFTRDTLDEALKAGIDFFTSGNHIAKKSEGLGLLSDKKLPMIRPANYPPNVPGDGYRVIEVGTTKIAVINLVGRHFIKEKFDCPFRAFDDILKDIPKSVKIIFVDFHAEATSEKVAFGWHVDGRASAVVGTHTHIPTADASILPKQTAYITDVGMCGAVDSVIGVEKDDIIAEFLDQLPRKHDIPETGQAKVNAVMIDIDKKSGKAESIERLDFVVEV
ncbi:TIGR00282 family metallophosphoesterase [Patescibacteria group bacterium]|nr:TIGR00282 family metallophosphoesterase [Patescibacteria group bacterium]